MASSLTVKVHPVVHLSIIDAYERRSQRAGMKSGALGTLLGIYEKNVVQVTNCYAIPYRESDNDVPEINDVFNKQMWQAFKRSSPAEQIVGWFTTNSHLSSSCTVYHSYYTSLIAEINVKKELPPVILLTMDVSFSSEKRLAVQAFLSSMAGIPGKPVQAHIFQPLKVEMDAFQGEAVALDFITKGVGRKQQIGVQTESSLDQLEKTTGTMVERLEALLAYVNKVLSQPEPPLEASRIGRKLMEMVNRASTEIPPGKLDAIVKGSLRDYSMIAYLSEMASTQLALQEKIISG